MIRALFSLIVFALFAVSANSQTANEMIAQHQKWVRQHIAIAKDLSDEQLLIETSRTIYSSCNDSLSMNFLLETEKRFGIVGLSSYATDRLNSIVDRNDKKARQFLYDLVQNSIKRFGKYSYTTAYLYFFLVQGENWDTIMPIAKDFYDVASGLCKIDSTILNQELLLCSTIFKIVAGRNWEDPSIYAEFINSVDRVVDFYSSNNIITEVRAAVYKYIGTYGEQLAYYLPYYTHVNEKSDFYRLGKSSYGYLTDKEHYNVKPSINFYTFLRLSIEYSKQLLHPNHPDFIIQEMEGYERQISTDIFGNEFYMMMRLKKMCDYFRLYYGENSIYLVVLHNYLRRTGLFNEAFKSEIEDYDRDLSYVSYYDDGEEWLKELTLESIVYYLTNKGAENLEYVKSLYDILDSKQIADPIHAISMKMGTAAILQYKQVPGFEAAFDDTVQQYFDILQSHRTWACATLGKAIASYILEYFKDYSTYLALQQQILMLEKELSTDNSDLFACEYIDYGKLISQTFPLIPLTLNGENNPEELYNDIVKVCKQSEMSLSAAAQLCAVNYYISSGNFKTAKHKSLQLEEELKNTSAPDLYPDFNEALNGFLMLCFAQENDRESVRKYAKIIEKYMGDNFVERYPSFDLYTTLANIYLTLNEKEKAKSILTRLFESFKQYNYPIYSTTYINVVNALIQMYGNSYNDMNKCRELLDICIEDFEQNKDLIDPMLYLEVLKLYFELLEIKEPGNIIALNEYLVKYQSATSRLLISSKNSDQIFYNYVLFNYSKIITFASKEPMLRNGAIMNNREEEFNNEWELYCDNVKNNVIPDIESKLEDSKKYPQAYCQMLYILAYAYEKCLHDYAKAETLYKESFSPQFAQSGISLGDMYLTQKKYNQADSVYSKVDDMLRKEIKDLNIRDEYLLSRIIFSSHYFLPSYFAGNFKKALGIAGEFSDLVNKYIERNFNYFTENERESFISMFGAGGIPFQMLMPYVPDIAGEVYNSLLKEKGLLLRTSKSVENAIYATNNLELISTLDSIKVLRTELSNMQTDDPISLNEFVNAKYKRLKEKEHYLSVAANAFIEQDGDVTWEDVRDNLKKNEAAIEYVVTNDSTLYALVLKSDSRVPQYVELMKSKSVGELITYMNEHTPDNVVKMFYQDNSFDLYSKIWYPLESYIKQGDVIYYSVAGFLNSIAFNSLLTNTGARLMDVFDLHQVTSTARIADRKKYSLRAIKKVPSVKFYGAICFEEDQIADYERVRNNVQTKNTLKREADSYFPFLDYSYDEIVNSKRALADKHIRVEELATGTQATEEEFRSMSANSPTVIHISTHGYYFTDLKSASKIIYFRNLANHNAMTHSGIVLSNAIPGWYGEVPISNHDNIVSSAEISALDLSSTELVVLSACRTGLGLSTSDGVIGLQRGFKLAGVNSLCVSMWEVNDNSTASLMQRFYSNLANSKWDYHKAFKDAIIYQRSISTSPYDWASFVLIDAPFK